ncbi:hypothetical protein MM236_13685 [Belliella sp. DSM 107340]|uniref:Outer membrane protein beta-barrel domain-containing protein n=1 Tax=Belliella calami TaxID=2923436 RepID=A0ABS9UR09_9BACT|nr:hypothetical protein [Belliella calami]MCH7399051.1 hypothetical protein [Belliella calami]
MKINLAIIGLFFLIIPQNLFSQDQKSNKFQVHVNYLNIENKIRGGANSGIGIGTEYHFPIVKSIGLDGIGGIGYERLLNCSLCQSEWFVNGYWAGIGLSKKFQIKDKHKFMTQVRYRYVGFERNEAELLEMDGTFVRWQEAKKPQDMLGFRFSYFLPVKVPVILSYTFENGSFHRMNSFSLGYQF